MKVTVKYFAGIRGRHKILFRRLLVVVGMRQPQPEGQPQKPGWREEKQPHFEQFS